MKKVVLGSSILLGAMIALALIFSGTMMINMRVNGVHSVIWKITLYGLRPAVYIFIGIAVLGLAVAVWGFFDKKD